MGVIKYRAIHFYEGSAGSLRSSDGETIDMLVTEVSDNQGERASSRHVWSTGGLHVVSLRTNKGRFELAASSRDLATLQQRLFGFNGSKPVNPSE